MSIKVTFDALDRFSLETEILAGSLEEIEDLKEAYLHTKGSIGEILTHIPHSTIDDESRFIIEITRLINQGSLPSMKEWQRSIKDEKARLIRQKKSQQEAKEAEGLAKELGVWDEFYDQGKPRKRNRKGKEAEEEEGDESVLKALIALNKEKDVQTMASFIDGLEAKYARTGKSGKGKKRRRIEVEGDNESSTKTARVEDISDNEWAEIQQRLFDRNLRAHPKKIKLERRRNGKSLNNFQLHSRYCLTLMYQQISLFFSNIHNYRLQEIETGSLRDNEWNLYPSSFWRGRLPPAL